MTTMMVIIVGENRVEYNKIRKSDYEKIFFDRRSQTYKVPPNNLLHMRMTDAKGRVKDEEAIVFKENASCPYDILPGVTYDQDSIFEEIDIVCAVNSSRFFKQSSFMRRVNEAVDSLYPLIGIGIIAIIMVWIGINMITG